MSDFNSLDLDSLDALLDAAEVEAVPAAENVPAAEDADPWASALAEQAATSEPEVDPWAEALAEQAAAPEPEVDPWADALSEQASAAVEPVIEALAPIPVPTPQPAPVAPAPTLAATEPVVPEAVIPHINETHEVDEGPIVKPIHANKKSAKTETWTDAEMDSIKKLIIIFSSVIIVLVLATIGISLGGLFSTASTDPKLVDAVEGVKTDVGQAYLVTEDSGKQLKTMGRQLSDVATQLADISEAIEALKKAPVVTHALAPTKAMTAAERKAVIREDAQASISADASDSTDAAEASLEKNEKSANSSQVKAIAVDILDVKRRLVATQKLLEQINKQSEALQLQSLTLTEAVKAVEVEVKSYKPVPKVVSVTPKAIATKKAEEAPVAQPVQVKPADDPQFRARWSREMGKSDGFP